MRISTLLLSLLLLSIDCLAEIKLPYLIDNKMVLQRDMQVPIWGWGQPDSEVSVKFDGQMQKTKIDASGKWLIKLAPMPASFNGKEMVITVANEQIKLHDILVGEVWLCSGQSNMEYTFESLVSKARSKEVMPIINQLTLDIEQSHDPLLRQVQARKSLSPFKPLYQGKGQWISVDPKENSQFSAAAFYFGQELRKTLKVPVGLVVNAYGGSPIEGWLPMAYWNKSPALTDFYDKSINRAKDAMANWDKEKVALQNKEITRQWQESIIKTKKSNKKSRKKPKLITSPDLNRSLPSTQYNAMLTPLVPYAIKGVIWYQGEANGNSGKFSDTYADMMTDLVNVWRKEWQNPSLPFYFVQLANFDIRRSSAAEKAQISDDWATVRDQQRLSLTIPHTGMAVISDIGQANNIHPKNKQDVGKRLALWALANTYKQNIDVYSGPLVNSAVTRGKNIIVNFDHTGSGLMTGEKTLLNPTLPTSNALNSFEIQDQDGNWHFTKAEVFDKHQIILLNEKHAKAKAVRYAWSMNPTLANLYNKEGLPASPFKIDIE